MLRCKKSISYHWGVQFEVGKIYQISNYFDQDVDVITYHDMYWEMNRIISLSGQYLIKKGIKDPLEIEKNLPGYIEALSCFENRKFTKKINLPFVSVYSESKSLHTFCSLNDKAISEKYNIDLKPNGEIPFVNTVATLYKNFDYISEIRNNKLNDLGI
jgi:hypothetical protein